MHVGGCNSNKGGAGIKKKLNWAINSMQGRVGFMIQLGPSD